MYVKSGSAREVSFLWYGLTKSNNVKDHYMWWLGTNCHTPHVVLQMTNSFFLHLFVYGTPMHVITQRFMYIINNVCFFVCLLFLHCVLVMTILSILATCAWVLHNWVLLFFLSHFIPYHLSFVLGPFTESYRDHKFSTQKTKTKKHDALSQHKLYWVYGF